MCGGRRMGGCGHVWRMCECKSLGTCLHMVCVCVCVGGGGGGASLVPRPEAREGILNITAKEALQRTNQITLF